MTRETAPSSHRAESRQVELIREELDTCLYAALATILRWNSWSESLALGAHWGFAFPLEGCEPTEYYFPCDEVSLLEAMMPGMGLSSTWWHSADQSESWETLVETVLRAGPTAVAVDNFFLPFRPAYGDVHSNHLIVVYDIDDRRDMAWVVDATPPKYMGPLPGHVLRLARGSATPRERTRDMFFTNGAVEGRLLMIEWAASPWAPRPADLVSRIQLNAGAMLDATTDDRWLRGARGISMLADRVDDLDPSDRLFSDLFVVSGSLLAGRGRHADFLRRTGRRLRNRTIGDAATAIEQATHRWATVRILTSREVRVRPTNARRRLCSELHEIATIESATAQALRAMG